MSLRRGAGAVLVEGRAGPDGKPRGRGATRPGRGSVARDGAHPCNGQVGAFGHHDWNVGRRAGKVKRWTTGQRLRADDVEPVRGPGMPLAALPSPNCEASRPSASRLPVQWWRGLDSNQRRHSQRIYSPSPLTTRAPLQICFRSHAARLSRASVDRVATARKHAKRLMAASLHPVNRAAVRNHRLFRRSLATHRQPPCGAL